MSHNYRNSWKLLWTQCNWRMILFNLQIFELTGLCRNFQSVIHDSSINKHTNMRGHRRQIPLVIQQHGKDESTHKPNEGEVNDVNNGKMPFIFQFNTNVSTWIFQNITTTDWNNVLCSHEAKMELFDNKHLRWVCIKIKDIFLDIIKGTLSQLQNTVEVLWFYGTVFPSKSLDTLSSYMASWTAWDSGTC